MAVLIFLPVYLFFVCIALFAYKQIRKKNPHAEKSEFKYIYAILGIVVSSLITGVSVAQIEYHGYADYGALFYQATLTVCVPTVFGIIFAVIYRAGFRKSISLMSFTSGVLNSVYFMPFLAIGVAAFYDDVVNAPEYYSLCSDAKIEFKEQVEPAKGVLLSPDQFTNAERGFPNRTRPIRDFLLNQTMLEYIETPSDSDAEYQYERTHTVGDRYVRTYGGEKRRLIGKSKDGKMTTFVTTPVDSITAKYVVIPKRMNFPKEKENGIGGSEIEVRRLSDNKLIAYTRYYWDDKTFKSCPKQAHRDLFPYQFIATALNVVNAESSVKSIY